MTTADQRDKLPQDGDIEPGEYRCFECGAAITATPNGVEVGHANGHTSGASILCPRREPHYENKRGELAS